MLAPTKHHWHRQRQWRCARRTWWTLLALWLAPARALAAARPLQSALDHSTDEPWFCHQLDCPRFTVVRSFDDLELRAYPASVWVSTTETGGYDSSVRLGFLKLFEYISGANEHGWRIDMTTPVRTLVTASGSSACDDRFTVSFYLPDEFQDGRTRPPAPNRDSVFIETTPAQSYWVVAYPGFTSQDKVVEKARATMNRLASAGEVYSGDAYYSSSYDPPFRLFNRHNEVLIPTTPITNPDSAEAPLASTASYGSDPADAKADA